MPVLFAQDTVFAGRYRIVKLIAKGGMGAVYEVVHTDTNRRRALKVMHSHVIEKEELRRRFESEVRIAANIESEHLIDVSDAGVDNATATPFMVMELLRGEDLSVRTKRLGRLPFDEVLIYMRQIATALDKTHAAAIVHRDIKPANLFLSYRDDESPRIKILDFGIAKIIAEGNSDQSSESLGTPLYMAPEQFMPGAKITPAVDIFALGLVTYTLLVGAAYWRPESKLPGGLIPFIAATICGPQESAVQRAASNGVVLPKDFDLWFFRAAASRPEDRFVSASACVEALANVFAGLDESSLAETVPRTPAPKASAPVRTQTTGEVSIAVGTGGNGQTAGTFTSPASPSNADMPRTSKSSVAAKFASISILIVVFTAIVVWSAVRTNRSEITPVHATQPDGNSLAILSSRVEPETLVDTVKTDGTTLAPGLGETPPLGTSDDPLSQPHSLKNSPTVRTTPSSNQASSAPGTKRGTTSNPKLIGRD